MRHPYRKIKMGYILHAFIGRKTDLQVVANRFPNATIVDVGQGMFIIPMTETLYDDINKLKVSPGFDNLTYMTKNVEDIILETIDGRQLAYIEAEYLGGQGGQSAILWQEGRRFKLFEFGQGVINTILRHFGIRAKPSFDEFDTIGLGRHRNTEEWLVM